MQYLNLLIVLLSFTSAAIIPGLGAEPHENKLQRRWEGNVPGDDDYVPEDDFAWHRKGGTEFSGDLQDRHDEIIAARARNPPPELTPATEEPPVLREVRSSTHRPRTGGRGETRTAQEEAAWKLSVTKMRKNYKGEEDRVKLTEIGFEYPPPKHLWKVSAGSGGTVGVDTGILAPGGRVEVATQEHIVHQISLGMAFYKSTRAWAQDHNPPPPAQVPVENPVRGRLYKTGRGTRVILNRDWEAIQDGTGYLVENTGPLYDINQKRSLNVINSIEKTTTAPSNATRNLQSEWQTYYAIFTQLQANASALLAPVFDNMVNNISNVSCIYEMAWSIQSQLVGSRCVYTGPYLNGWTSFDNFTDNWLLASGFLIDTDGTIYQPINRTISNTTMLAAQTMLGVNYWLENTYYTAWDAAVNALNVTNPTTGYTVLEDLVYFASVITVTNRADVVDPSFLTFDETAAKEEAAWFLEGLNVKST